MSNLNNGQEAKGPRIAIKTIGAWVGMGVGIIALFSGFTKSFYETPMKLQQHEQEIHALQETDNATTKDLREMRDLLLEMRADLKYVKQKQ